MDSIFIKLTPEQVEQLQPFVSTIVEAYEQGEPGILMGQAYAQVSEPGVIDVCEFRFIPYLTSKAVVAVLNLGKVR